MVCFCLRDWKELDQSQKPLCTVYTTFEMTSCYRKGTKSGRLDADMNCMFYNRASTVDCLRKVGMLCDSSMERFCLINFKTHFCFCFGFSVYSYLWRTANVCAHSCLFWNKKKSKWKLITNTFSDYIQIPNDWDLIENVAFFKSFNLKMISFLWPKLKLLFGSSQIMLENFSSSDVVKAKEGCTKY